ncbi:unnamed protein product [Absidia cylindrospora]
MAVDQHIAVFNTLPPSSMLPSNTKLFSFDNQTHIVVGASLHHLRRSLQVTLESNQPVSTASTHVRDSIQMDPPSWGLARISQRYLPNIKAFAYPVQAGKDVDIYIVDSGVDIHHPDMAGRALWGGNFVLGSPDTDEHGHGTLIAGIAGGSVFGVAKKATLIAVKCLDANGTGDVATIIQGLHFILQRLQQAPSRAIINLSIVAGKSDALNQAVDALSRAGAMVVVAAGNYHQDSTTRDACQYSPASASTVISVGSTDDTDHFASFSNDGPCVTLLAPGTSILSSDHDKVTTWYSGTSYSAPHVAGIAALLWSSSSSMDHAQMVIQHLYALATPDIILNVTQGTPNLLVYNGVDPVTSDACSSFFPSLFLFSLSFLLSFR